VADMNQKTTEMIACPFCGHEQKMTLWAVIRGDVNTRIKKRIIDGNFFDFKCEHCGEVHTVTYPTLYEDDTHHSMVYLAGSLEHQVEAQQIIAKRRLVVDEKYDYAIRIAESANEFREKVGLISSGLDDRFIEIIKVVLLEKVRSTNKNADIHEVRCFALKDGNLEFSFLGKKDSSLIVKGDFYDYISQKCEEMLKHQDPNPLTVDLSWAVEFLDRNHFVID
jgi:hypothetical protein